MSSGSEQVGLLVTAGIKVHPYTPIQLASAALFNTYKLLQPTYGNGIDIRFMASKCLFTRAFSDVPQLGASITGTRHKTLVVGRKGQ